MDISQISSNLDIPKPPHFDEVCRIKEKPFDPIVVIKLANGRHARVDFVDGFLHSCSSKVIGRALDRREVTEAIEEEKRRSIERILHGKKIKSFLPSPSREEFDNLINFAPLFVGSKSSPYIDPYMLLRILRMFPRIAGEIYEETLARKIKQAEQEREWREVRSKMKPILIVPGESSSDLEQVEWNLDKFVKAL
jgi:hypothetical protein